MTRRKAAAGILVQAALTAVLPAVPEGVDVAEKPGEIGRVVSDKQP